MIIKNIDAHAHAHVNVYVYFYYVFIEEDMYVSLLNIHMYICFIPIFLNHFLKFMQTCNFIPGRSDQKYDELQMTTKQNLILATSLPKMENFN